MHKIHTGINLIVLLALLIVAAGSAPSTLHAQEDPDKFIAQLMEQMSPRAKVGQLFVVAFPGTDAGPNSDIAKLITEYNIGGVVLSASAGNIVNTDNTSLQVAQFTAALQNLAYTPSPIITPTEKVAPSVPLFIAIPYEIGFQSYSQVISGLTPLPSLMALGATWKPEEAYAIGSLAGQELAALGINVVLGPSFDLLTAPAQAGPSGVQMFGGDPYWVGVLGQEFVRGLREGSSNRVTAALSHFPGQGGAISSEGTIDKSLDDLKKRDLPPFLRTLTGPTGEERPVADAFMVTQVRYRSFLALRERTQPIVVSAPVMKLLLEDLPEVKEWREAGGVLFSDSLGSPALRRYYDPQRLSLPTRRVAQEAFAAGNDVLVLSNFGEDNWQAQMNAITDTISFFQDKYSTDLTFQARVNDAVGRILRLKYRLYPGFEASLVQANAEAIEDVVGLGRALTAQVAQDAFTQLWPEPKHVGEQEPLLAIQPEDTLLILTDDRMVRDCPTCSPRHVIDTDALASAIIRRYSPSEQVDPARVISLNFFDIQAYLEGRLGEDGPDVEAALTAADWVILVIVDAQAEPTSTLLRQLLVERPDVLGGLQEGSERKKVIALSFGVPYSLDKSQVARLTAHYGLYDNSAPFVEAATQVLFGEASAPGAPPVSVPATGYDLARQTEPDPGQFIQIFVNEAPTGGDVTPQPVSIEVGDTLKLRTGLIWDRNGHPVPDDTPVTFTRIFSEGIELPPQTVGTRNGIAMVEFVLDKIGPLRIRAFSEPALTSYELRVAIQPGQAATFATVAPPTLTPTPIPPTPTFTPSPTVTPSPTPTPEPPPPSWGELLNDPRAPRRVRFNDLLMALLGISGISLIAYRAVTLNTDSEQVEVVAMRWALGCSVAGLIGYLLYSLGVPGISGLDSLGSIWASLIVSVIFAALPMIAAIGWHRSGNVRN